MKCTKPTVLWAAFLAATAFSARAQVLRFLRGEAIGLPVSIADALEAGVAALALDQARQTGQVVDLTETWARFDSYGLRG